MATERLIMGLFQDEDRAVAAVASLARSPWRLVTVHSPILSHKLAAALGRPKSRVGYFTLAGGVIGFFCGFLLAIFTATRWSLIVGGKPIVALIPFFIVGFEFTILFAVFGNVIGMLALTRLPRWGTLKHYDPRCSGAHFGILAGCEAGRENELCAFFKQNGAEVNRFEDT